MPSTVRRVALAASPPRALGGDLAGLDQLGDPLEVGGAFLGDEQRQALPHHRREQRPAQLPAHAGEAAGVLTADEDGRPTRLESSPEPRQGRTAADVEDQVVVAGAVGEVIAGVVEDVVGTEGGHEIDLGRAADPGDLGSQLLGDLHGVTADAS
jgi:hypothetical protein